LSASWVERQLERRDSSGCEEATAEKAGEALWGVLRDWLERRVSWTPGAEGAEGARAVCWAWPAWGTMRRDCEKSECG